MLETAKGTKDFLPEEMIVINRIIDIARKNAEKFGFSPLETPAIENEEVLTMKYAGGQEIMKQMYKLTDRANRKLALRYDLTVPLARVISSNPQLPKPFKRYQYGKIWREEFGTRDREFIQFDIDVIGNSSLLADAELLKFFNAFFDELKIKYVIKVNTRNLLTSVLSYCKIENINEAIICIDKLEKLGKEGIIKEAISKGINKASIEKAINLLQDKAIFNKLKGKIDDSVLNEINELLSAIKSFDVKNIVFTPTLARGLDYYTGPIFEVYLKSEQNKFSIAAGGRYDNMIGRYANKNEKIPATGISLGITRIYNIIKKLDKKTVADLFIIPIKLDSNILKILNELRANDIKADVDLLNRNISKNLSYANNLNIPYVLIIGEKELKSKKLKLKDMKTGKEKLLSLQLLIKFFNKQKEKV